MLETLRIENAGVKLSIMRYSDDSSEEEMPLSSGKFHPPPNEFVYIRTHVSNSSSEYSKRRAQDKWLSMIQQNYQLCSLSI